jgi:hypothetical protein
MQFPKYNDYHFAEALEDGYQLKVYPETLRRWPVARPSAAITHRAITVDVASAGPVSASRQSARSRRPAVFGDSCCGGLKKWMRSG